MSEDQAVSAPVDVAAIRAALARATPGPWAIGAHIPGHEQVAWTDARAAEEGVAEWTISAPDPCPYQETANAELIVLLRNNAEALLRMLDDGYCAGYDHGVEDQMDRQEAALAEAERRGAIKALRNLPDHLKPNMSLVAQIDARADAIENGGDH